MSDPDCYIYVMATIGEAGDCSPVKIGIARNPVARLSVIRTACPNPIRIQMFFGPVSRALARRVEREAHKTFANWRLQGEWFGVEPKYVISHISDLVSLLCIGKTDAVTWAKRAAELGVTAARMQETVDTKE